MTRPTDAEVRCQNCANWERHHPRDAAGYCSKHSNSMAFEDDRCDDFTAQETTDD